MRDLLVLEVDEDALDHVAHVLEVDGERDDLGPAAAVLLVERLAADLREVELHRGVEAVDVVVEADELLDPLLVVGADHLHHAVEHLLDGVADAQRLARGVGERQRRRLERAGVEVPGLGRLRAEGGGLGEPLLARGARSRSVKKRKPTASARLKITWKCSTWRRGSGSSCAMPCRTSGSASEKTTQPTTLKKRLPSATRRPPPGVPIVATSPMRPLPRFAPSTRHMATGTEITLRGGERRREQHDGEARPREDREERADQHVEHRVAGERAEEHLGARGGDDGLRGLLDELQREDDEAQADRHAAELPGLRVLARQEEDDAEEDGERREPARGPARTPAP